MKYCIAFLILLGTITHANAQVAFGAKKVTFVGKDIQVPDSCNAETDFQVNCEGSYYIAWLEINKMIATDMCQSFVGEAEQNKNSAKKKIKCLIDGQKADAWLIHYDTDKGKPQSQIIATSTIKGKDIFIHAVIFSHVNTNADIPGIAAQILQIVE